VPLLTLAATTLTFIVLSPLAFHWLAAKLTVNWPLLSEVGQTYGAVSAILSGMAILGVVYSLRVQANESVAVRLNTNRQKHFELLRLALDDPMLASVWGDVKSRNMEEFRTGVYANLILGYWQTEYIVGTISKGRLRVLLANFFRREANRQYWSEYRNDWAANPRAQIGGFSSVIDSVYREALSTPVQAATLGPAIIPRGTSSRGHAAWAAGGLAAGVIGTAIWAVKGKSR
jgi:hypothetical protein